MGKNIEACDELKEDVEEFVRSHLDPFMQTFLEHFQTWDAKYTSEQATEVASRLFAYMIHRPVAGLTAEGAADLINDIGQKAFLMYVEVQKENISNDNALMN